MTGQVPWVQFSPGDFLERTAEMSHAAAGCLMRLVSIQVQRGGSLPSDLAALERLVPGVRRHWDEIAGEFVHQDGRLVHPTFEAARLRAIEAMAKKRKAGLAGSEARWRRDQEGEGPGPTQRPPGSGTANGSATSDAIGGAIGNGTGVASGRGIATANARREEREETRHKQSSSLSFLGSERRRDGAAGGTTTTTSLAGNTDQAMATAIVSAYPRSSNDLPHLDERAALTAIETERAVDDGASADEILAAAKVYAAGHPADPLWPRAWLKQRGYMPYVLSARRRQAGEVIGRIDGSAGRPTLARSEWEERRRQVEQSLHGLDGDRLDRLFRTTVDREPDQRIREFYERVGTSHPTVREAMATTLAAGATA